MYVVLRYDVRGGSAVGVLTDVFLFVGVLWVRLDRVFRQLAVRVVELAVEGFVDVRGVRRKGTFFGLSFVYVIILINRRCFVWNFFFISSVIFRVSEA